MPTDPLSPALDRLYGAPLEDFVAVRTKLAAELKAAGEAAASKAIAAAPKPTRTAWALNQVSRRQPELPRALLRARDAAFTPTPGDADGLRQAMRAYRDKITDIVRAARDLMAEGGMEPNAIQLRRMTETVQAASADEGARTQLLGGTLVRDTEAEDPLALLAAGAAALDKSGKNEKATAAPAVDRKREQDRHDREERARSLAEARARVSELEGASRDALARMRTAQNEAHRAARELAHAKQELEEVDARLAEARKKLVE